MRKILITSFFSIYYLIGCGSSPTRPIEPSNQNREYYQDNFDFSQFKGVDWHKPETFGETCTCVGNSKHPLPAHVIKPDLGITDDNYFAVYVLGDGSCWIRSAMHVILFHALANDTTFTVLINNIKKLSNDFSQVSGFSNRFRHNDLITLLSTLKSLTPKERFKQYNKVKVDAFLDYSMRALLHAQKAGALSKEPSKFKLESLKKLITAKSWGAGAPASEDLAQMLLDKNNVFVTLHGDSLVAKSENTSLKFSDFNERNSFSIAKDNIERAKSAVSSADTIPQVEHECRLRKQAYEITPKEDPTWRQKRIDAYQCDYKLIVKRWAHEWGLTNLADCHKNKAFNIFSYNPTRNHYELLIHKNVTSAFEF